MGLGVASVRVEDFSDPRNDGDTPRSVLATFLREPTPNKLVYISAHGEPGTGHLLFRWRSNGRIRDQKLAPSAFRHSFGRVGLLLQSCFSGFWLREPHEGYFVIGTAGAPYESSW